MHPPGARHMSMHGCMLQVDRSDACRLLWSYRGDKAAACCRQHRHQRPGREGVSRCSEPAEGTCPCMHACHRRTALMHAIDCGHIEVAKLLLAAASIDINVQDEEG